MRSYTTMEISMKMVMNAVRQAGGSENVGPCFEPVWHLA